MAQTTTNYGLLKPESTDSYNHLIYDNPNMDTIDAAMKANADAAITTATCIKSGTTHTITRSNTDASVMRFTATGDWNSGDTMIVDGVTVTPYLANGDALIDKAFLINTEVLMSLSGLRATVYTNANVASNIEYSAGVSVSQAIAAASTAAGTEYSAGVSVADELNTINSVTPTIDYSELNDQAKSFTFNDWSTYLVTIQKGGSLPSIAIMSKMAGSNPAQIAWLAANYGAGSTSIAGNTITCSESGSYYQMIVLRLAGR